MAFDQFLLFLTHKASAVLMVYKQILHLDIVESLLYSALTPVVLLAEASGILLGIQKPYSGNRFPVHSHAEAHPCRCLDISRLHTLKIAIQNIYIQASVNRIVVAEVREAEYCSTVCIWGSAAYFGISENGQHQTCQPAGRKLRICIDKGNMSPCLL